MRFALKAMSPKTHGLQVMSVSGGQPGTTYPLVFSLVEEVASLDAASETQKRINLFKNVKTVLLHNELEKKNLVNSIIGYFKL